MPEPIYSFEIQKNIKFKHCCFYANLLKAAYTIGFTKNSQKIQTLVIHRKAQKVFEFVLVVLGDKQWL